MPSVALLGCFCTGHDGYPSRPNISASEDVFCNDIAVHRQGDLWDIHCKESCHDAFTQDGSPDVFVNDLPLARVNDALSCGSLILTGSEDNFSNE
jgi:uncharacterized Zn-binding protein involved in type VI secretion